MNFDLLIENLKNPALLFFLLGVLAVRVKSDLYIPENSSKFISIYLLFAIGFKGGQELAHSTFDVSILWCVLFGVLAAISIPIYTFFILKRKLSVANSGAIAAAYGSVSAVTFVTAISFLEMQNISYSGHMVAVMALMEAPAIIVGIILIRLFTKSKKEVHSYSLKQIIVHSLTNGSVFLIVGSLVIGYVASEEQAMGIKPFTNDLFKGFLALFLLDMGLVCGKKLSDFTKYGNFTILFASIIPLINGCVVAYTSGLFLTQTGDRFLLAILAASASYIAVPAAMKIAVPKANPGLYVPMAIGVTFPINLTLGIPFYYYILNSY